MELFILRNTNASTMKHEQRNVKYVLKYVMRIFYRCGSRTGAPNFANKNAQQPPQLLQQRTGLGRNLTPERRKAKKQRLPIRTALAGPDLTQTLPPTVVDQVPPADRSAPQGTARLNRWRRQWLVWEALRRVKVGPLPRAPSPPFRTLWVDRC